MIIQQLLDRPEIKLNSKNTHGLVPLHLAAQNGHVALTALLASKEGTNLNSKDLIGKRSSVSSTTVLQLCEETFIMYKYLNIVLCHAMDEQE